MQRNSLLAIMLMLAVLPACAQTEALLQRLSPTANPNWQVYRNPALMAQRYPASFSEASVAYHTETSSQAPVAQLGKDRYQGSFQALSYQPLDKHDAVWGNASYRRRHTTDVCWNETADFLKVYPYVTADTVGGKMEQEAYLFNLGYAGNKGKWAYGIEASYSSAMDYRDIDPRPKDNSTQVDFCIGTARQVTNRYQVGGYLHWQHYAQEQNIAFMNPYGTVMLYQMTGLGTHYHRFAGTLGDAYYTGNTWGGGITLHTLQTRGMEIQAGTQHMHLQKQMNNLNNAPVNDIYEWSHNAQIAWHQRDRYISLSAYYTNRTGMERFYDDGVHNYQQIATSKPFKATTLATQLKAAQEWSLNSKWQLALCPSISLLKHDQSYASPQRQLSFTSLIPAVNLQVLHYLSHNKIFY